MAACTVSGCKAALSNTSPGRKPAGARCRRPGRFGGSNTAHAAGQGGAAGTVSGAGPLPLRCGRCRGNEPTRPPSSVSNTAGSTNRRDTAKGRPVRVFQHLGNAGEAVHRDDGARPNRADSRLHDTVPTRVLHHPRTTDMLAAVPACAPGRGNVRHRPASGGPTGACARSPASTSPGRWTGLLTASRPRGRSPQVVDARREQRHLHLLDGPQMATGRRCRPTATRPPLHDGRRSLAHRPAVYQGPTRPAGRHPRGLTAGAPSS